MPAARQEISLFDQRAIEDIAFVLRGATQYKQRVVDPADQPPAGQIRGPADASALAVVVDPAPKPTLRRAAGAHVANRSQIIHPGETMQITREILIRRGDFPQA